MNAFSEWDFTLPKYLKLCRCILDSQYRVVTVADYLIGKDRLEGEHIVILRHDVDRRPHNALRMAAVEAAVGIRSTYYFRAKTHTLKPALILKIAQLGHEIGYHYENLSDTRGNRERAIRDFEANLKKLRKLFPIETICMHGRPFSAWDNRDLWKDYDYREFGLIGEPYLSIDYSQIVYLSDTGRSWSPNRFNRRDKVGCGLKRRVRSTAELMHILSARESNTFLIQCHPERWANGFSQWLWSFSSDWIANYTKLFLSLLWAK